jgi:hypothetical protein
VRDVDRIRPAREQGEVPGAPDAGRGEAADDVRALEPQHAGEHPHHASARIAHRRAHVHHRGPPVAAQHRLGDRRSAGPRHLLEERAIAQRDAGASLEQRHVGDDPPRGIEHEHVVEQGEQRDVVGEERAQAVR